MKQQIANYTVIIEKQKRIGANKSCYMAFVPILGIATDAETLEKVEKGIKSLIQFHVESLAQEGEEIPVETGSSFITRSEIILPKGALLA